MEGRHFPPSFNDPDLSIPIQRSDSDRTSIGPEISLDYSPVARSLPLSLPLHLTQKQEEEEEEEPEAIKSFSLLLPTLDIWFRHFNKHLSLVRTMAASSSLTLSQTLLSQAISHPTSSDRIDRLALPGFRLSNLSGRTLDSSSPLAARLRRRLGAIRAPKAPVRAAAVETLEKTETALLEKSVNTIRFLAIDAVEKANSGHPGLPMGCAPMGHILYDEVMRYNPKNPYWFNRDRFVLSAGHGCMLQYALLHLAGYDSVKVSLFLLNFWCFWLIWVDGLGGFCFVFGSCIFFFVFVSFENFNR